MSKKIKVGIIGAGGVGLTCVAFMAKSADVIVKTRRDAQAAALNEKGVTAIGHDSDERVVTGFVATSDMKRLSDCQVIFITVKSYDTAAIAKELKDVIGNDTEIVSLQNGIEAVPIMSKIIGEQQSFAGVTWVGATRTDDTTIKLGTMTKTVVDQNAKLATKVLNDSEYDSPNSENIKELVWDKLALNVAQNALGAITNLNLGEMGQSQYCLDIGKQLLVEFESVANAEGVTFNDSLMDKLVDNWTGSHHHPSMWQDLQGGKQTEIDALNGAILALGKKHGINTPYNAMITQLVKTIE